MLWESQQSTQPLQDAIRYFRGLEFFAQDDALTDEGLMNKIKALHAQAWDEDLDATRERSDWREHSDLLLLNWDKERIWWEDTEADVGYENQVYERVLKEWSDISRGAFLPAYIQENWSHEGLIEVRFPLNGKLQSVQPKYCDDWLDLEILIPINNLIVDTGFQFELYTARDQTAFIVVLTADEKQQLIQERGWAFAT